MKPGAIFDMDGTLTDTERLYHQAWGAVCAQRGLQITEEFRHALAGLPQELATRVIRQYYPSVDDPLAFYRDGMNWVWQEAKRHLPLRPGAREILEYLRGQGVKMALASSNWRAMILDHLNNSGLREYFDVVVSGEEVKNGKPAPDIFLLAAERLGLPPEDCYVLEDSVSGARAGVAAGCASVMIVDLFQPTDDLKSSCAAMFSSLLEAMDAMQNGRL